MLYSFKGIETNQVIVGKVDDYTITAPIEGFVKYLVQEGDFVKKGQLVGLINTNAFQAELNIIIDELKNIQAQINEATPTIEGTEPYVMTLRAHLDNLTNTQERLKKRGKILQYYIAHNEIRSEYAGRIVWRANQTGTLREGDEVYHVQPGIVYLGDLTNSGDYSISFTNDVPITTNNVFMLETPGGYTIACHG